MFHTNSSPLYLYARVRVAGDPDAGGRETALGLVGKCVAIL